MQTKYPVLDSRYWRHRAAETRAKADKLALDVKSKLKLLKVAEEYERLAEHADQSPPSDRCA